MYIVFNEAILQSPCSAIVSRHIQSFYWVGQLELPAGGIFSAVLSDRPQLPTERGHPPTTVYSHSREPHYHTHPHARSRGDTHEEARSLLCEHSENPEPSVHAARRLHRT